MKALPNGKSSESIAELIQRHLNEQGLSCAAAGRLSGGVVGQRYVHRVASGVLKNPQPILLKAIGKVLKIPEWELCSIAFGLDSANAKTVSIANHYSELSEEKKAVIDAVVNALHQPL